MSEREPGSWWWVIEWNNSAAVPVPACWLDDGTWRIDGRSCNTVHEILCRIPEPAAHDRACDGELQHAKAEALDWLEAIFKKERDAWSLVRIDPVNLEIVAVNEESPADAEDTVAETILEAVQAAMRKAKP